MAGPLIIPTPPRAPVKLCNHSLLMFVLQSANMGYTKVQKPYCMEAQLIFEAFQLVYPTLDGTGTLMDGTIRDSGKKIFPLMLRF